MQDSAIDYIRESRVYLPFETGSLITIAVNESGSTSHTEGDLLASPTDVAVQQNELSNFGIAGVTMAGDDIIHGIIPSLRHVDPQFPIGFRIHWTNSGAAAANRGVTFILLTKVVKQGAVYAIATAALDTILIESLVTGVWFNEVTGRGFLDTLALTRSEIENGAKLEFSLEADVVDGSVADLRYLGIEMDFVPQHTIGAGSHLNRPFQSDGVA